MKKCMGTCFSQNICFNIYRYTLHDFTEENSLKSKNNCIATSIVYNAHGYSIYHYSYHLISNIWIFHCAGNQ